VTPGIPDPPLPFTGGRIPASETERAFVERRVLMQSIIAPAVSLGAVIGGYSLGWPRLAAVGVLALGLTGLGVGWLAVSERRLTFIRGGALTPKACRYFIYEGFAAVPYGLAFAVAGVALAVCGLLVFAGTNLDAMRVAVLTRPHLALLPVGTGLLFYGCGFLIGFRRAGSSWSERLAIAFAHLPAQLGGLILVTLGVGTLVIGLVEWVEPTVFRQEFESVFGNPWPFDSAQTEPR
jgi:hypothetical protein